MENFNWDDGEPAAEGILEVGRLTDGKSDKVFFMALPEDGKTRHCQEH